MRAGQQRTSRTAAGDTVPGVTVVLSDEARAALLAGRLAHLVTVNADGSPQLSAVWVGLDGDDIVCARRRVGGVGPWAAGH